MRDTDDMHIIDIGVIRLTGKAFGAEKFEPKARRLANTEKTITNSVDMISSGVAVYSCR